jgi:hypothetical protein
MFSFTRGKKIARIEGGGKQSGKIIYLYDPDRKCCINCSERCNQKRKKCCKDCRGGCFDCQDSRKGGVVDSGFDNQYIDIDNLLNDQYYRNKKKKIKLVELQKVKRAIMKNIEPIEEELNKIYQEARQDINNVNKYMITLTSPDYMIPLPNDNEEEADHIYIAGQTGAGKSSWIGNYVKELKKIYPGYEIFLFSTFDEDKALDYLNPVRIQINEDLIQEPITKDELTNSIVIFDDIDTIKPKKLADEVRSLRDDLLQNGRKKNIRVISTSHQLMNYRMTRDVLNSSQKVVFFPQATSPYHINRFLKDYIGLDGKAREYVKKINSRWIMVSKNYPSYLLWEHGSLMLNKIEEMANINHKATKNYSNNH